MSTAFTSKALKTRVLRLVCWKPGGRGGFIATLRQLRVLQETLWTRLVLLHPGKNIPKEERLSFGKCEKSVPKRGTFEFWVLTERGKCDEGKKIVCFF